MPSVNLTALNNLYASANAKPGNYSDPFLMIENYIYLHHVDKFLVLPAFVDSVTDSLPVTFSPSNPISRSAPIYSYAYSGPRSIQTTFDLHRDLMQDLNKDISNIPVTVDNDYIDLFIKYVQAATLPSYEAASKMVNPPQVSLRLGNDIFIKGIISGGVGIVYKYPILSNGRYADVQISLTINEVDPYDANMILNMGSFRYVSTDLNRNMTVVGDTGASSIGATGRAATNAATTAVAVKAASALSTAANRIAATTAVNSAVSAATSAAANIIIAGNNLSGGGRR